MIKLILYFLLLLLFVVNQPVAPLYSYNQNTYFAHGLANSSMPELGTDLIVQSPTPFYIFNKSVEIITAADQEWGFTVFFYILGIIYIAFVTGIVRKVLSLSFEQTLCLVALIIIIHSESFRYFSQLLTGWNIQALLTEGIAGQYLLGTGLQPSAFGVLLMPAVYFLITGRKAAGVFALCLAAGLHSSYITAGGLILLADAIAERKSGCWQSARPLICYILFALPLCLSLGFVFNSAPQEIQEQAAELIVKKIIPTHADIQTIITPFALVQLFVVVVGLLVLPASKYKTFSVIVACELFMLIFIQAVADSNGVAMLMPWRISVMLVPLATAVLTGAMIKYGGRVFYDRRTWAILFIAAAFFTVQSLSLNRARFNYYYNLDYNKAARFIKGLASPVHLLIPPDRHYQNFRLWSQHPVLVDRQSHPYAPNDVLEWHKRLTVAESFYSAPDCQKLKKISSLFRLTHALVRKEDINGECMETLYSDENYKVLRIGS